MTAEHALSNLRSRWEKVLSRKAKIEIPELGKPGKPYPCEYRALDASEEAEIMKNATDWNEELGRDKLNFIKHNALIIIHSLRVPMSGDPIFTMEHLPELMSGDPAWLSRVAGEIRDGQEEMKTSAEEVKNSYNQEGQQQE